MVVVSAAEPAHNGEWRLSVCPRLTVGREDACRAHRVLTRHGVGTMHSSDAPMNTPSSPAGETLWRHVVHLRSPRAVVHTLRALVERPLRHRRHKVLQPVRRASPGLWWSGDDRWFPADFPPRQGNRLT